jgi:hypothetical protein
MRTGNPMSLLRGAVLLLLCGLPLLHAVAQEDFYHPELNWKSIETTHFIVSYHDGAERTARVIAKISEEIYDPVTSLYNHKPDQKVRFIVRDVDDLANGAAYFFDNRIEILAPNMDYELRGTHNWLRNVITHEFTHIIQIQTSMKYGRAMPAGYLQWITYESERRQDVLYGYPNTIIVYPVSGFVVPAWFAEGVAQYNRRELRYDFWDSHRDMILRSYALDGNMLSWEDMGVFGKTSLGNESSYNAGFAFVNYIASTYGENKLPEISRNLGHLGTVTISGAIEDAVGKPGSKVYDEWRSTIRREYLDRTAKVRSFLQEGHPLSLGLHDDVVDPGEIQSIETMERPGLLLPAEAYRAPSCCQVAASSGFANLYPAFSPDGKRLAYTSAKGGDYFSMSSLYVYDFETNTDSLIMPGVRTGVSWSPDGEKLYYGKNTRSNPHWSLQFDLYEFDLATRDEKRLTEGRRASAPAISPDGKTIAFVVEADGTSNLALVNIDGTGFRLLTRYTGGEQVYSPKWSPSADRIVFDYSLKDGRDIGWVRPDGAELAMLVEGPDDERSAEFSRDGSSMLFTSDRTGISNIYAMDLATRAVTQRSNVIGGAFLPTVNPGGDIVYAAYTSGGYKLYRLNAPASVAAEGHAYVQLPLQMPPASEPAGTPTTPQFDWAALRTYDDRQAPSFEEKPYKPIFGSLSVMPFLRVDNYNPKATGLELLKAGVYLSSTDVLDRTSIFASGALNILLERDLYFQFQYTGKIPLLYQIGIEPVAAIELYNVTRKTNATINLPASSIPVDVTYDLFEADFVLGQKAFSQFTDLEFRYIHSRYASIIGSFVNPETTPETLVPGSRETYLIGNWFKLTFTLNAIVPSTTSEINPAGRKIRLVAGYELNKFNGDGEYEVTSIGLQPVYKNVDFPELEILWSEHIPMPFRRHTLTARFQGAVILGGPVDEFFDFYAGGMPGMRGYPFYGLGGNTMAMLNLNYRFPIFNKIDIRVAQLYFDKLYFSLFGDFGNAWTGVSPTLQDFKKDIGAELRLQAFSYYAFPTSIFLSAAYGFDRFSRKFVDTGQTVTYGKEWAFYFGVLFGFDLD